MKFCDTCHSTFPADFSTCPKDQTRLRLSTDLIAGMVIRDKYAIVEKIGTGGMASVYRATHLVFNEPRAVKVVSSRMMEDENFLKRFRNEAVITRKLQHPNAVRVEDVDSLEDGRPCIIMELVEGRNLRKVIEEEGPLPAERALEVARQAGSALGAAHKLGITHRDIKPDNIVLLRQGDGRDLVKVLDFGIAKLREGAGGGAYTATQTGMVIGTPQYISPEQALGNRGDEIDGRADLYSLGVVIYEMLTGRLPFQSDTPMGLLLQHMQAELPPPQEVRPDLKIPKAVTQLLMQLLEKDPAKRCQTAEEMIAAIEFIKGGQAEEDETPTRVIEAGDYWAPSETVGAADKGQRTVQVAGTTVAVAPAGATAAPAAKSGAGKWMAAVALLAVVLAGGYFAVSKRAATVAPAPASSPAPPRPAAQAPAGRSRTASAQPASPEAKAQPGLQHQERRVRELLASGRKHIDDGEYDSAIRDLQSALHIDPANAAAQAELQRAQQAKRTEEQVLGRRH